MQNFNKYRFVFGAGGTGGHLYPALAVAEKIKEKKPEAEILFLGNKNKIEGKVLPKTDFAFKPIIVAGFMRGEIWRNILFPFKLLLGLLQSLSACFKFKPRVAVGTGAYVAGPVMWAADFMGAKVILLEQNSYPGVTNRLLDRKATEIFAAFEESKKYFRVPEKVKVVGNPVRVNVKTISKDEAREKLGLQKDAKAILVLGGSLGALSINEAVAEIVEKTKGEKYVWLWQTGAAYFEKYKKYADENIRVFDFIEDIGVFYSAADLVIARAGATTIAELAALGLPAVLIPSPNVAANHQYKNAEELFKAGAVKLIEDSKAKEKLFETIEAVINDENELEKLKNNIKKFAKPDAAEIIAKRAIELAEKF